MQPRSSNFSMDPLLPDSIPQHLLDKCDQLQKETVRLDTLLAPETATRVGHLLRATNSFYSNLIEGQYTEPLTLAEKAPKRDKKQLTALAFNHMESQRIFERMLTLMRPAWSDLFSPALLSTLHSHLFRHAAPADLRLQDGSLMTPGRLRTQDVCVGNHIPPEHSSVHEMLKRLQDVYGRQKDFRRQLLGALAYHHRYAWVHPFPDGNGRTMRLITHLHLQHLGLVSNLWSLSRGLARRQSDYYARLHNADQPRQGDLDGRGQLSQRGLFEFIDFMLDTCLDQVAYMLNALATHGLRERLEIIVQSHPNMKAAGIRIEAARALHILLTQGKVSRADFKIFLGLGDRLATAQLTELIKLGVVESTTPRAREIHPGLPGWFAQQVFPDLHRRFNA